MWERVIGQQRVKSILAAAFHARRLPHAYLFTGNEGVGKDAMALELKRVIQCKNRAGDEACNICDSCVKVNLLQHPDVKLITSLPVGRNEQSDDDPLVKLTAADIEAVQEQYRLKATNPYHRIAIPKANIIKINSIRKVRRESSMSSLYHGMKVFIISNADELGDEASNTLLKTLEEPPGETLFVLTTSRPESLLPTIVSRCQPVHFDPLNEDDIRKALIERESVDVPQATLVSRLANGSYVRSLELLHARVAELRIDVVTFVRNILANNIVNLAQHIEKLSAEKDREFVVQYLMLLLMWFRDAFVLAQGGEIINQDQREELDRFITKFPRANLPGALSAIEDCISLVYKNGYIPLALTQLAIKLKRAMQPQSLVALL